MGSLTERSRQILQRDKVARKELVVEEELEVDEEAAETMNDISEDAMSAWNNIDDDSQDDDSDYEWDNNEEEVDDQDDHDDTEPHTISWDSYKNVDNIDGLDFIPPKPYVKGSMSPLEIAYVDLMYRLNHHNVDLNMFDEIVEWLCGFSDKHSGIFDKIPKKMRMKRGTFINQVRKKFGGTRSAMPVVKEVSLPSGRVASLPTFDFRKLATEMLVDKTLMTDDNMKQTNLDLNTLLPIVPIYHRSTDPRREKKHGRNKFWRKRHLSLRSLLYLQWIELLLDQGWRYSPNTIFLRSPSGVLVGSMAYTKYAVIPRSYLNSCGNLTQVWERAK